MTNFVWKTENSSGDHVLFIDEQEKARIPLDTLNFIMESETDPANEIIYLKNYFENFVSSFF